MHRLWIRLLLAAIGGIGLTPAASAQSAQAQLGVSATVTRSCVVSTSGAAGTAIACIGGTSWTGSTTGDPRSAGTLPEAAKSLQAAAQTGPSSPRILFVTISF